MDSKALILCLQLPEELLTGEKHFQLLADFVPQLMWLANADGWAYWYNRKWYDYTGTTPKQMEGWGWKAVHHPETLPAVMEQWTRSIATSEPFEMVFPLRAADGSYRPFLTRIQPLKGSQGAVLRWFGTNTDVSEQKRAEENLQLLLNELNHRVKNTLASVQAIASQSFRTSPREEREAFQQRVAALSRAHDMLIQAKWKPAGLRMIVSQSIAPICDSCADDRITIDGPEVLIPANRVAAWSMALHELAINALKHGAFKGPVGQVKIEWSVPRDAWLSFRWIEHGGPPVKGFGHHGFGSRLIESLGRELAGTTAMQFEPEGIICTIEAPLNVAGDRDLK
jgi:PAS domain S-box-containing protein